MDATTSRTVVIAPRLDEAKAWCRTHGVEPHSQHTALRSTPDSIRGLSFTPGDRLVILEGTPIETTVEVLYPALITAPGYPDIATRIRDWFAAGARTVSFDHVFGAAT